VRFLIDSMLPPATAAQLAALGHAGTTPAGLGAHNLPGDVLVTLATAEDRVIVTENASDFAAVTACPVPLVLKTWWPSRSLTTSVASALDRWAKTNPQPGNWAHWLAAELR
jgi:predicted nuclease of predicted toxin-antitoxin system